MKMGDGVPGRVRSVSSGNGSVSSPGTKKPSPGCRPAVASRKEREWPLPETVSSCPDVLVTWDQATRLTPWTLGPEDTTAWTLQGAPFLVSGSKSSPRHPAIKTFLRDSKEKRPDSYLRSMPANLTLTTRVTVLLKTANCVTNSLPVTLTH